MNTGSYCFRCKTEVEVEADQTMDGKYPYYCPTCDENMYGFEVLTAEEAGIQAANEGLGTTTIATISFTGDDIEKADATLKETVEEYAKAGWKLVATDQTLIVKMLFGRPEAVAEYMDELKKKVDAEVKEE